jgi:hypothetical protein
MDILFNSDKLEKEILDNYFIDYRIYLESKILSPVTEDGICYKCGKELRPLTLLEKEFAYLPCWDCASKKKTDRLLLTESIQRNIHDFYYNRILGDRYLQLFIVDDIYFKNTIPHDYSVFKKILNSMDPPSRNDIWFLDWIPGYPKIISLENISGLKIVNINNNCKDIETSNNHIKIGEYDIEFPELVSYDSKHHSRYNLFNKNSNRRAKKLKFAGDKCIRFFNTDNDNVKSIFKLTKNGEEVAIRTLSHKDFVLIKLTLMRNKVFLKLIFDIILEIIKNSSVVKDSVFLKNNILVDPSKNLEFSFTWTSVVDDAKEDVINISVI